MGGSLANIPERLRFYPKTLHAQRKRYRAAQVEIDREVNVQVGVLGHDPGGAALWRYGRLLGLEGCCSTGNDVACRSERVVGVEGR